MLLQSADPDRDKDWYFGPWNSALQIAAGYANTGVDEPHLHRHIHEVYLIARGEATVRMEGQAVHLRAGDVLVVEPGEAHTFLGSTPDYFHFVVHTPVLAGDRQAVSRARLLDEDARAAHF